MKNCFDSKNLFGDEYNFVMLSEFSHDISLLKRLIEIVEEYVQTKIPKDMFSFEGICSIFAKSIVEYAKSAYDNMIMGHLNITYMINRVIIENNVCLEIISKNKEKKLWQYYIVYSYKDSLKLKCEDLRNKEKSFIEELCRDYSLDNDFTDTSSGKKPFIDRPYGWTYKINNKFNFEGLCDLVDKRDYKDFRFMSKYSHGTAIYLKMSSYTSFDSIMNMLSCLYIGLYRLVMVYCPELQDEEFDELTYEMESIFYDYINFSEDLFD